MEDGLNIPITPAIPRLRAAGISLGSPQHRWLLFLGDLMLIMAANFVSTWIRIGLAANTLSLYSIAVSVTLVLYPLTLYVFDLYNLERTFRSWETGFRSGLTVAFGGVFSIFVFYVLDKGQFGRGIMAIEMGLTWLFLNGWRWAYGALFQSSAIRKVPVLILGAGGCGSTICELLGSPFSPYDVRGFLDDDPARHGLPRSAPVLGAVGELREIASRVGATAAILAIPKNRPPELIRNILHARLRGGIDVREMADVYEELTGRIPINHIGDQWLLYADGFSLIHREYLQRLKRLVDIGFSSFLLLLTAPVFLVAALAVRLDSPGPIFYRQERVGKDQRVFTICKFRSMRQDAESGGAIWAAERDPRVTKVGQWLRLTHIDELPQIWNVFKGDMSVVGPRPERPEFVRMLDEEVPYYAVRHAVRPGITGWAQVSYRYGSSIEDAMRKLESDLYYVKNMSLFLDLKIMLRTVGVIFLTDGAR
jgi:sugar transferase (PEP-CTERM system associated)